MRHTETYSQAEIVARLKKAQTELEAEGCTHLALFGSLARGDARPNSDIDLAAIYDPAIVSSGWGMAGVAAKIEAVLGMHNFDLANEEKLRPAVKARFELEHVRIF